MMKVKWLKGSDDLTDAYNIRIKVFVDEQKVPFEEEIDEIDKLAEHIIVYENDMSMGTGRVFCQNGQYFLGRIAVLKDYRGKNIGDYIVRQLLKNAFEMGAKEVHIHAQITAQNFYSKQGFKPYGTVYYEAGIEHINMKVKA